MASLVQPSMTNKFHRSVMAMQGYIMYTINMSPPPPPSVGVVVFSSNLRVSPSINKICMHNPSYIFDGNSSKLHACL